MKEYLSKPEINFMLSILIPLLALAVAWGIFSQKVNHLEAMTLGLQRQYDLDKSDREDLKIRIAEIQKDISYIREKLDEHTNQK